jgi:hypothetical protein
MNAATEIVEYTQQEQADALARLRDLMGEPAPDMLARARAFATSHGDQAAELPE